VVREFRKEFDILKREVETPGYFKDLLIKNYTYKEPMLEWYLRVKIRLEKNYRFFNDIIPRSGSIVDIGCGYGFLSYMLGLTSPQREITGIDYDEDKIRVANNCAIKTPHIHFIAQDITEYEFPKADVFVMNDVLHYLPAGLQIETIEKCIGKLNPDGMILIRDANTDLKNRHLGTRYTEFFSTNFGFNKTKHKLSFLSKSVIEKLVENHSLQMETVDKTLFTSNLIYVIRNTKSYVEI
jgi:2-polyprenyl-3-methyl-5-hydroxy-6-metoxy-1,4-benzoquinol methylase